MDVPGAISVTLWSYMGWDNAATVAQEVKDPQRNYPRAMIVSVGLVAVTYLLPLLAVGLAGLGAAQFSTGAWTDAAHVLVGPWLGLAVVIGGMISGVGMFNPLMMSYARVPYAIAKDGLLPRVLSRENRRGVPVAALVACAVLWATALRFSFERLISIDLVLYGASLLLEFVALAVLRRREPDLHRPFRIPGGFAGTVAAGIGPALLIGFALWAARDERIGPISALLFAAGVGGSGVLVYAVANRFAKAKDRRVGRSSRSISEPKDIAE